MRQLQRIQRAVSAVEASAPVVARPLAPLLHEIPAGARSADPSSEQAVPSEQGYGHQFGQIGITPAPIQRDPTPGSGNLTLQTPPLFPAGGARPGIRPEAAPQLHLSPEFQAMALRHIKTQLDPTFLESVLGRARLGTPPGPPINLNLPPQGPTAGPPAPPGVGQPPPVAPTAPVPQPYDGDPGLRDGSSGTPGDLIDALKMVPEVKGMLGGLADRASAHWSAFGTAGKVGIVSGGVFIAGGVLGGILADPARRQWAAEQLSGRVLPVPGVSWLNLEVNLHPDKLFVGAHVDIGGLLPPEWGFGPSPWSAQPVSPPPTYDALAPGQRAVAAGETAPTEPDLGARVRAASGGGQPLDTATRATFEDGLGADLTGVRIHTDGEADRLARAVSAEAFTSGRDIFFRAGNYDPQSRGGRELLAHETVHTVQQAAGPVAGTPHPGGIALSDPADRFERDAVRDAARLVAGEAAPLAAPVPATPHAAQAAVQRAAHNIGQMAVLPARATGGDLTVQRAPDPAEEGADPGAIPPLAGGEGAVPLDAKAANGSTTLQDPPAMQNTTVHGKTLADVAAAISEEAGSLVYDFSVGAEGEPITSATLDVQQTMTLPIWAEREKAPARAQGEWDRFLDALTRHENGHVAINRQMFANAHRRYLGKATSQTGAISDRLRAEVDAKQEAYDDRTDHGRTGTPSTTIDTSFDKPAPGTTPPAGSATQPTSILDLPDDAEPPSLQARLVIGPVDDPYEREADAVAERVLRLDRAEQVAPLSIARVQRRVQRVCAQCAKAIETGEGELCPECAAKAGRSEDDRLLARKASAAASDGASQPAPDVVATTLEGGGAPLDRETRDDMEWRFGHDFSRVRIHTDDRAAISARAVQARAYTVGHDIAFAANEYAPTTRQGQWLLAHELTHTIQQGGAGAMAAPLIQRAPPTAPPAATPQTPYPNERARIDKALQSKDPADVKAIGRGWSILASDDEKFELIGILLNQGWVGPLDEYALEDIWESFGNNIVNVASGKGLVLWNLSVERGAELYKNHSLDYLRDAFKADVSKKASGYLATNRAKAEEELKKIGDTGAAGAPTAAQNDYVEGMKKAGERVKGAQASITRITGMSVIYSPESAVGPPENAMMNYRYASLFNPDSSNAPPPGSDKRMIAPDQEGNYPTWAAAKSKYDDCQGIIKSETTRYPALFTLVRDGNINDFAGGDLNQARQEAVKSLQLTLDNISKTEPLVANPASTFPLELKPIHDQLFQSDPRWRTPFARQVAEHTIAEHDNIEFWKTIGVSTIMAGLIVVAELGTAGAATPFLIAGAGVSAKQAYDSWDKYLTYQSAAKTQATPGTALIAEGQVSEALSTALLDTVFAFLDAYQAGVGAAKAAATAGEAAGKAGERLAEAEARRTEGLLEAEIKQKQNWEFTDSVTGELHSAHASERGLEICSDPPCLIIPERMRQRFERLNPQPGGPHPPSPLPLPADEATKLNALIASAETNSQAWGKKMVSYNEIVAEREVLRKQQGKLTFDQFKTFNRRLSDLEREMGELFDGAQKLEEGFGALAREHQVRIGIASEPGMGMPHGVSDSAVRTSLGMRADEPCADILAGNSRGGWIIAESKGDDLAHAIEQLENTETGLRAFDAKNPGSYGGVTNVEYRIYPTQTVYDNLVNGRGIGLSQYALDNAGLLTLNGSGVTTPLHGRAVRILPPPRGL